MVRSAKAGASPMQIVFRKGLMVLKRRKSKMLFEAGGEIEAVVTLGRALTAIVNLFSPDALLFSGGLSKEETLYLNPLIDYISSHAYSSGKLPVLQKASLGEASSLIGAALFPTTLS